MSEWLGPLQGGNALEIRADFSAGIQLVELFVCFTCWPPAIAYGVPLLLGQAGLSIVCARPEQGGRFLCGGKSMYPQPVGIYREQRSVVGDVVISLQLVGEIVED